MEISALQIQSRSPSPGNFMRLIDIGVEPCQSFFEVRKAKMFKDPKILIRNGEIINPSTEAEICYRNMIKIDDFCRKVFKRCPVENESKTMIIELNRPLADNNALWIRDAELVISGETDQKIFSKALITDEDILSHEFGLAFIQYVCDLEYESESGALHRSLSDVFAIMRKHYSNSQKANDPNTNWLIGEDIIVNDFARKALRSLDNPGSAHKSELYGSDYQIKHMSDIDSSWEKFEKMHASSGIPNYVFYLAASKEGGYSWDKIGKIWFSALEVISKQLENTQSIVVDFNYFAQTTIKIAKEVYGSDIENIIAQSWTRVGVNPDPYKIREFKVKKWI